MTVSFQPIWVPHGERGNLLLVSLEYSREMWPWAGWLALFLGVIAEAGGWEGTVTGEVRLSVESTVEAETGESILRVSELTLPVRAKIVATPPRQLSSTTLECV